MRNVISKLRALELNSSFGYCLVAVLLLGKPTLFADSTE